MVKSYIAKNINNLLYICTMEIRVGDRVKYRLNNHKDYSYIDGICELVDGNRYRIDGLDLVIDFSSPHQVCFKLYPICYKIIGFVSSDAVWVRDGDRFNKDELFSTGVGLNWNNDGYHHFKVRSSECRCFH